MKEELTREVLEAIKNCDDRKCASCPAKCVCVSGVDIVHIELAAALLEERAKPKVWDGAPDEADYVTVGAYKNEGPLVPIKVKCYHRELPKTRARIMAEEIASAHISNKDDLIDIIEQTINNHMKELEGKE